jgi:polyisoprenyl-phosphate glycosyltransferase
VVKKFSTHLGISIVVPVYNEHEVFPALVTHLKLVLDQLNDAAEVLFVNDGSCDSTEQLIDEICEEDDRFIGVHLSRNFGHQAAVSAGMAQARGEAVAVIDGDLQDPPEFIPEMLKKMREGYDIVYAIREDRKESMVKRLSYTTYYRLLAALSPIPIPLDSGDFGIISRRVVDIINSMPERHRFVRGLRSYVGFRQVGFPYQRAQRTFGYPKYSFVKLCTLAADGIFAFSELPLRIATVVGLVVAGLSLIHGTYLVLWRLITQEELPGFATLAVGLFFLGSVQLICIGILGEYIGRIHSEVKQRPSYIVREIKSGRCSPCE